MKVAALWTGGKDSSLACYKALKQGLEVAFVMTFIWDRPPPSHPLPLIRLQSEVLEIPFYWERVTPPYFEAYKLAVQELKEDFGIEGLVSGDISHIDSFHGNWLDDVCKDTGVEMIKPLWEMDRAQIFEDLVDNGFKAMFTCVKEPWFSEAWLGRTINTKIIKELKVRSSETSMDICGENGEYHTMTLDAPFYRQAIHVKFETEKNRSSYFIKPTCLSLSNKS